MTPLPQTSPERIVSLAKAMIDYAFGKLAQKNARYADATDGLLNLRHCEAFGVSTEQGIIVRLADKMQRINRERNEPAVAPANLGNTEHGLDNNDLADAINYLALLYAVRVVRSEANEMVATEIDSDLEFALKELKARKEAMREVAGWCDIPPPLEDGCFEPCDIDLGDTGHPSERDYHEDWR